MAEAAAQDPFGHWLGAWPELGWACRLSASVSACKESISGGSADDDDGEKMRHRNFLFYRRTQFSVWSMKTVDNIRKISPKNDSFCSKRFLENYFLEIGANLFFFNLLFPGGLESKNSELKKVRKLGRLTNEKKEGKRSGLLRRLSFLFLAPVCLLKRVTGCPRWNESQSHAQKNVLL